MGGYEDYLIEKYTQRGLAQGMLLAVKNLMENMQWTSEQAMDALNIPEKTGRSMPKTSNQICRCGRGRIRS